MKIEQAYDKVVLTNEEVQEALRAAVTAKTGRQVRGHVVVNMAKAQTATQQRESYPQTEGAAYCYLESKE